MAVAWLAVARGGAAAARGRAEPALAGGEGERIQITGGIYVVTKVLSSMVLGDW